MTCGKTGCRVGMADALERVDEVGCTASLSGLVALVPDSLRFSLPDS